MGVYKKLSESAKKDGFASVEQYVLHNEIADIIKGLDRAYARTFIIDLPVFGEMTESTKVKTHNPLKSCKGNTDLR